MNNIQEIVIDDYAYSCWAHTSPDNYDESITVTDNSISYYFKPEYTSMEMPYIHWAYRSDDIFYGDENRSERINNYKQFWDEVCSLAETCIEDEDEIVYDANPFELIIRYDDGTEIKKYYFDHLVKLKRIAKMIKKMIPKKLSPRSDLYK